jgi:hypothetical protein
MALPGNQHPALRCESFTYRKKNSHHQGSSWPKNPGKIVPPAAPTGAMAPNRPTHKLRLIPGGKDIVKIATAFGTMIPPPMPLSVRIRMIVSIVRMKPVRR